MLSLALLVAFATCSVFGQDNAIIPAGIECLPKGDLFHPDATQCDKYYECTDKGPQQRLCPDGLVFDVVRGGIERCDYPFNVDCGDRLQLQPPSSRSIECPRENGIFAHEDPSVCNKFYLCVGGEHQLYTCDKDLHFNEYTGVCEWQSVAGRAGCRVISDTLEDGFSCPANTSIELNGVSIIHPLFAHPTDCQKYYVCLNGKVPRANSCPSPTVFNDVNMKCDDPANVPGCENWFGDVEEPVVEAKPSGNSKSSPLELRRQR